LREVRVALSARSESDDIVLHDSKAGRKSTDRNPGIIEPGTVMAPVVVLRPVEELTAASMEHSQGPLRLRVSGAWAAASTVHAKLASNEFTGSRHTEEVWRAISRNGGGAGERKARGGADLRSGGR